MVKAKYTSAEIKEIVNSLAKSLLSKRIIVDKIILYGSYAKGNPREHSDIDVAIISPSFKGKRFFEIQAAFACAFPEYLSAVEPIGYSTDDYRSAERESLLGEIRKHGKVLWNASDRTKRHSGQKTKKQKRGVGS